MAFDGTLLNRPSDAERPISTALLFQYTGVFVQPAVSVVSPDGDGVADRQSLRYKVVRPSTVTVTLTAPDGTVAYTETAERRRQRAGSYARRRSRRLRSCRLRSPPRRDARRRPSPTTFSRRADTAAGERPLEARRSRPSTTRAGLRDGAGLHRQHDARVSRPRRPASCSCRPPAATSRSRGSRRRAARVVVTVETPAGEVVRTLARRSYPAGSPALVWNGLDRDSARRSRAAGTSSGSWRGTRSGRSS